jgi:hypothetical protein
MLSEAHPLTSADLSDRIIEALVSPVRGSQTKHIPPAWPKVWSDVRAIFGPVRSVFFVIKVVVFLPFQLFWYGTLGLTPIVKSLLLAAVLGVAAMWFTGWPGLLAVCLFVWLFALFRQNQKSPPSRE